MATRLPSLMAACCAMFSAIAVLPTLGLAAMMVRSDFCQPPVISSNCASPEPTPCAVPRLWRIQSNLLMASSSSVRIPAKSFFFIVRAMA